MNSAARRVPSLLSDLATFGFVGVALAVALVVLPELLCTLLVP